MYIVSHSARYADYGVQMYSLVSNAQCTEKHNSAQHIIVGKFSIAIHYWVKDRLGIIYIKFNWNLRKRDSFQGSRPCNVRNRATEN